MTSRQTPWDGVRPMLNDSYRHIVDMRPTLSDCIESGLVDIAEALGHYPIFAEEYRPKLNQAIINHFWLRPIAHDTPQTFAFYLARMMREHMPEYNRLYAAIVAGHDPLETVDTTMDGTGTGHSTQSQGSTSKQASTGKTRNIVSQTPQTFLKNPDGEQYMSSLTQGTTGSDGTSDSHMTGDADTTTTQRTHTHGLGGGLASASLAMLGSGVGNVDLMVCDMLEPCFAQDWEIG